MVDKKILPKSAVVELFLSLNYIFYPHNATQMIRFD